MQAADITTCKELNAIGRKQLKTTETTRHWANWLLDYLATHPNGRTQFWKSDMRLLIHSDASFLVEWAGKSNYQGFFYLGWKQSDEEEQKINGTIVVSVSILPLVAISVAEAEMGEAFYNRKKGKVLRLTIYEMGFKQGPTTIFVDNKTVSKICNNTIK